MILRRSLFQTAGFVALVALVGCGSKQSGAYATVSGVVTYKDAPVEGAKVTFHSTVEVEGKTMSYSALTDSNGKYLIAAVGKDPGLPAGMYKVTVTKFEGGKSATPGEGMDAGQLDAMASDQGMAAKGGPKNLLPAEYATAANTKLSATLEPGKNEKVNFDLKGPGGK